MDAIRVGEKWFGCVLGAGFDSRVNDRANRMSWPKGRMRYNIAMLAELGVFAPLPFEIIARRRGAEDRRDAGRVGNAKSYGAGMQVLPDADVTDGLLDIMVLGPVSKPEFLKTFPKVFKGTHVTHPAVTMRRAKVVELVIAGRDGVRRRRVPRRPSDQVRVRPGSGAHPRLGRDESDIP